MFVPTPRQYLYFIFGVIYAKFGVSLNLFSVKQILGMVCKYSCTYLGSLSDPGRPRRQDRLNG
jgi:hypothetical protein